MPTKPMTSDELAARMCDGSLLVKVVSLNKRLFDGRPQLVLTLEREDGEAFDLVLTRELARDLWRVLGPNKMVADFFQGGEGLQ